ncbi:MAG: bifunctional (p)ppGpp synthetase/guanosine-3',5'-bis(diphosphate) 3'-pyrophosphohydrolase [Chloroflexi bacterium]|nr:bifunctional (p)ppGpp synthetase/guanosine-3',5'-bis(diphosphate) 3'-pyrophosphohydrolase [Chloroflexota bacterium]
MDERSACSPVELAGLITALQPRADAKELAIVCRAYEVAEAAHTGQVRQSGELYITHPLAVAGILTDLNLDVGTIAAALLHDVVEDTPITLEQIREQFGDEVVLMVDGVTKLSQREGIRPALVGEALNGENGETFEYRTEREAESLRKMMLSVVKDIRVVLIKLADRLHNMRTLSAMKPEKQRRIARETLDIYAPLANRLGIWEWKQELEDLGLRYAEPDAYTHISNLLAMGAAEREATIRSYIETVRTSLHEFGIDNIEVTGRAKQIYSLWRKMQRKGATFDQIRDTQAIRIIIEDENEEPGTANDADEADSDENAADSIRERKLAARKRLMGDPSVQACYTALGIVHRLWPPIPGEFDDYIAVPKDNHYQSLHTAVQTRTGMLEVQIRTRSMHRSAEFGVAAHWLYKDSTHLDENYQRQIEALRNAIRSIGSDTEDATSFVNALKNEQLIELVFAFTPKGKVIELPAGATVLDFAYRIHSDIGDRCRGGRINGMMQPVSCQVHNGDVIEVLTRKEPMPSRDWLHSNTYCITANAKHKIRAFFRKQDREQNIIAGRDIIEREIKRMGVSSWMKPADLFRIFRVEPGKEDDFLERIGFGNITSVSINSHIMEEERRRAQERTERLTTLGGLVDLLRPRMTPLHTSTGRGKGEFIVAGVPGLQVQVAQCCQPVPGDPVVGYVTRGQGIRVHHRECKNINNAEQERLIDVVYEGASQDVFTVQLLVIAAERTGLLGELATALGEQKINIIDCSIAKRDLKHGEVQVWIKAEVGHIGDISTAMSRLKSVRNVFDVQRVTNGRR